MKKNYTFLFLLLFLFSISAVNAQNKTWDGGAGDNLWSSPNNWNPNGLPGATHWVGIAGASIVMDIDATILGVHSLGVSSGASADLTINSGVILTTTNRGFKLDNAASTLTVEGTYDASHLDANYSGIYNLSGNVVINGIVTIDDVVNGYGINCTAGSIINNGEIAVTNVVTTKEPIFISGGSMTNNGVITLSSLSPSTFALRGNITNSATGTINGNSTNSTATIQNTVSFAGGTISPGMSIGQLSFRGGLTTSGAIDYVAEVSKTGAFTESDHLYFFNAGAGSFDISNLDLIINDIGGTALTIGDDFDIIRGPLGGGYVGAFNSVTSPGYTFTIAYGGPNVTITVATVLPVNLTYFNAQQKGEEVSLSWQTATEIENAGFEIQKSADGRNWEKLTFVDGMGTSYESTNYTFMDNAPTTGANYYRLKQIDYDGGSEFSAIKMVDLGRDTEINIFPNPSNGVFFIDVTTIEKETTATIFSTDGKEVMQVELEGNRIDLSTLTSGTYYIEIGTVSKQVVIK